MGLNTTKYYDEFLRYAELSKWQHENCNLGSIPYEDTPFDDDLMKNVHLYDVCERKYAGFTQILLDMWYKTEDHPYNHKMKPWRRELSEKYDRISWGVEEWVYVFFVHRLTGSGINYAKNASGYHNSILLHLYECNSVQDMVDVIRTYTGPKFTSSGYQIAPFPKPQGNYTRGGDWFMCEVLPDLVDFFTNYFTSGPKKNFRDMMKWLEDYNRARGFRVFWFQYAATLADIADFFPEFVNRESPFFYGKNAIECLNYLAEKPSGVSQLEFLDQIMERISKDTGALAYNAEDIACDSIRWIENYINPKGDYSHLDMDNVWSSHQIIDHPYGRQKPMIELGIINTFNGLGHPSDDKILKDAGITIEEYKMKVNTLLER
jgi:hypothetical protein